MGTVRLRGRVWWLRYYVNGRRREESSGSEDLGYALELLAKRGPAHATTIQHCATCGEAPMKGPRAVSLSWLRKIERRYGGRLPNVNTLEMLHEQAAWARLSSTSVHPSDRLSSSGCPPPTE
jgi:hypothetical protein